jgi:death-on-curing protein
MHYLSPHDLLMIHQALLLEFGGMAGITESGFGRLETAAYAPQHSMFGADLYPDLPDKAAVLVTSLIRNHPFSDGNKRIAAAALCLFLERNQRHLRASRADLEAFTLLVSRSRLRDPHLAAWIAARV